MLGPGWGHPSVSRPDSSHRVKYLMHRCWDPGVTRGSQKCATEPQPCTPPHACLVVAAPREQASAELEIASDACCTRLAFWMLELPPEGLIVLHPDLRHVPEALHHRSPHTFRQHSPLQPYLEPCRRAAGYNSATLAWKALSPCLPSAPPRPRPFSHLPVTTCPATAFEIFMQRRRA